MTKSYIDSKSVNYDRRSTLLGAAAIPLVAVPFIASTAKAAITPVAGTIGHNLVEDEAIRLCAEYEASDRAWADAAEALDQYDQHLPRPWIAPYNDDIFNTAIDIDIYVQQRIYLGSEDRGYHKLAKKWKAELLSARLKHEAAASKLGKLHLAQAYSRAMDRNSEAFIAVLKCKPTSGEGMAQKLEIMRHCRFIDFYMDAFVEQLSEFGRVI